MKAKLLSAAGVMDIEMEDIEALVSYGFVEHLPNGSYRITQAGFDEVDLRKKDA